MTKLELTVSAESLDCIGCVGATARILGCDGVLESKKAVSMSILLANMNEFQVFTTAVRELQDKRQRQRNSSTFTTLNLVFSAPYAEQCGLPMDRRPLGGVFASPMKAIHCCRELQLACFTHIELSKDGETLAINALEYAREHRQNVLHQEFCSWLMEKHSEGTVVASKVDGELVYWNPSMQVDADVAAAGAGAGDTTTMNKNDDSVIFHDLMQELKSLNAKLRNDTESRNQHAMKRDLYLRMIGEAVQVGETGIMITAESNTIVWTNATAASILLPDDRSSSQTLIGSFPWDLRSRQEHNLTPYFAEAATALKNAITAEKFDDTVALSGLVVKESETGTSALVTIQRFEEDGRRFHVIILKDMSCCERHAEESRLLADEALAASEAKTDMVQMLSHDLRAPLQGIMGVSSTMLLDLRPEETNLVDGVSTILASSRLLLTLINNVLDLRKADLNMIHDIELSPVSIRECIDDSMRFCSPFAFVNEVSLSKSGSEDDLYVVANRLRLEQVLVNLFTNGIKYTSSGTRVIVSWKVSSASAAMTEARSASASDLDYLSPEASNESCNEGRVVIVSVRDQGAGIPDDEAHKVFDAFVQLRVSEEKDRNRKTGGGSLGAGQASGFGLGLNLCMQFLRRMNGHIWYRNCLEDGGAEFCFSIPLSPSLRAQSGVMIPRSDHTFRLPPYEASKFRVLVVDDSVINVKVLSRMFRRLGVQIVDTASNGPQALQLIKEKMDKDPSQWPNMVVSDMKMPEMSGDVLCSRIRSLKWHVPPAVIAWTASWSTGVEDRCRDAGFDGALCKPATIADVEDFLVQRLYF